MYAILIHILSIFNNDNKIDVDIVNKLTKMLDEYNVHAKSFRVARDRYREQPFCDLKFRLITDKTKDGRLYNIPNISEVAALIVGNVDSASPRDIIMENRSGKLETINELHTSYLGFQYPLLFPYEEDGYRHDVNHRLTSTSKNMKRNCLTDLTKNHLLGRVIARKSFYSYYFIT